MREGMTHIYVVRNAQGVIVRARESEPGLDPMPQGWTVARLPLATPELLADKERLDWFETHCDAVPAVHDVHGWSVNPIQHNKPSERRETLRAAIDAARAARPEGQSDE